MMNNKNQANLDFLDKPFMVMEMRPEFSLIYKTCPELRVRKEHLKSTKIFKEYIGKVARQWKSGRYYLRSSIGPFASFNIKDKKVNLIRESNGRQPYLCWAFLGRVR
ncbi:hypothetical protein HZB88_02615 [archaeon]|nr:hypothetical protein [archaeon]